MEQTIISELEERIHELLPIEGLKLSAPVREKVAAGSSHFSAHARISRQRFEVAAAAVPPHKLALLPELISRLDAYAKRKPSRVPVIVARYLSPQRQKQCKEAGVNFIDLSGNVFLRHGQIFVERTGFVSRFPEVRKGRGPFSDKASLILRTLLSEKDRAWGVREMAHQVGLNPGFVSRMAQELESRGYIARTDAKIKLRQPNQILEDWVREYSFKKSRRESYFCLAKNPEVILEKIRRLNIPENLIYALGLHAGAGLVAPHAVYREVHMYVSSREAADFFKDKLNLRGSSIGANLILLFPFYRQSVFWGAQEIKGLQVASDLQLYLDLYDYPMRGREQAEHLYAKRLKKQAEG